MRIIIFASIVSLTAAVPLSQSDYSNKKPAKRGIFDNISHFPFLASSSSAHGSSGSSSSSDSKDHEGYDHEHGLHDEFHHDSLPDFHSVSHHTSDLIHHPESYPIEEHHDGISHHYNHFGHDDVATSYQYQNFGHDDIALSYQNQYLFNNHLSSFGDDHHYNEHFDGIQDSLLDNSHLDAQGGDYKNYGGDLGEYSQHAGLLDISDDHNIDHLLDPYSPSHSSYDSY